MNDRDICSEVIRACDSRLAYLWSLEPTNPAEEAAKWRETCDLQSERFEAWSQIFGVDSQGRGKITTIHEDDGFPI